MARLRTGLVIEPGADVADPRYTSFLARLPADGVPWHPARAGERFEIDGVRGTVLHPIPGWAGWGEDVNEDSLVLLIEYGEFQALFAGDAGFPAEAGDAGPAPAGGPAQGGTSRQPRQHRRRVARPRSRPPVAVISLGRNDYGHPAPATLERLRAHGVAVHRTDLEGTITVVTDGLRMTVRSRDGTADYDVR